MTSRLGAWWRWLRVTLIRLRAWVFPPHPPLTGDLRQTWPHKRLWQKPGPWCRTKARLGRRGAMLSTLGILYVLLGYRELQMVAAPLRGAFLFHVPVWLRAAGWVITGIIAASYSMRGGVVKGSHSRWPSLFRGDTPGWLILLVMPTLTTLSYGGSFLAWVIFDYLLVHIDNLPMHGDPDAWTNVLLRVPYFVVVFVCSGWVENPRKDCT